MLSDELNDYYFIKNMIKQKVILGHITQCFFLKSYFCTCSCKVESGVLGTKPCAVMTGPSEDDCKPLLWVAWTNMTMIRGFLTLSTAAAKTASCGTNGVIFLGKGPPTSLGPLPSEGLWHSSHNSSPRALQALPNAYICARSTRRGSNWGERGEVDPQEMSWS